MFRRALGPLLLVLCMTLSASAGAQGIQTFTHDDLQARGQFEAARDAYDRGRFSEALRLFEHAYQLSGRSGMLFNIGRAAEADDDAERAISAYESYLAALPQADNREFVQARLAKLRSRTGRSPAPARTREARPDPLVQSTSAPVLSDAMESTGDAEPREPGRHNLQLYAGMRVGMGGRLDWGGGSGTSSSTLSPSFGLQFGAGWVGRILGLGVEVRTIWYGDEKWATGKEDIKGTSYEVVIKPRVGHRFSRLPLEAYGALPLGLAMAPRRDGDDSWTTDGKREAGFIVGVMVGGSYFFSEHVGLNVETGYAWLNFGNAGLSSIREYTLLRANAVCAF